MKAILLCVAFLLPTFTLAEICTDNICEFELFIRHARTMVYKHGSKYYVVGLNGTKLQVKESYDKISPNPLIGTFVNESDVITGDGFVKTVATINGQFPGPPIEVQEGSQVAVTVVNGLLREEVVIHWHGFTMDGTTWMDGVPFTTQCPIPSGQSFTYRFIANPIGTHWYHSHLTGQKIDGVYGLLVVHPKNKMPVLPSLPLLLGDWYHVEGGTLEVISPSSNIRPNRGTGEDIFVHPSLRDYSHDGVNNAALRWVSGLINGRGRFNDEKFPLTKFHVKRGSTYLFRMVNVGAEFSLKVSIDGHALKVIASDGHDLEPVIVDYILINPGETIDFEVEANHIEGKYWLRAMTPHDYSTYQTFDNKEHGVRAVFVYEYIDDLIDPTSQPRPCTKTNKCKEFNCPYGSYPPSYNMTCINFDQLKSTMTERYIMENYGIHDTDPLDVFLNIGYTGGSSINSRRHQRPKAPLYQGEVGIVECIKTCGDPSGWTDACPCTFVMSLPYNKTIQVIMSNFQDVSYVGHHPMHIHGHNFAVMHIGYAIHDAVTGRWVMPNPDVRCKDALCTDLEWSGARPTFNVTRPALKDTVIVPARGYTVVRMKSLNPGYWLFHCHMNHHLENGMAGIFGEATDRIAPAPQGSPICNGFTYTSQEFEEQLMKSKNYLKMGKHAGLLNNPPSTHAPNKDEENGVCKGKEGYEYIKLGDFVGACLGCVVLGFIIAVVPLLIYVSCGQGKSEKGIITSNH